jgi:hypothetical protein
LHKSDVEALIGMRPYEEEKVVTFDVEEPAKVNETAKEDATNEPVVPEITLPEPNA